MKSPLTYRIVIGCVVLAVIVTGSFGVMLNAVNAGTTASATAREADAEVDAASRLKTLVVDMDNGLSSFALTGEDRFLVVYSAALKSLPAAATRLNEFVADEPTEMRVVAAIQADIRHYVQNFAEPLRERVRDGMTAAEKANAAAESSRQMNDLRGRLDAFSTDEQLVRDAARQRADDSAERAVLFGTTGLGGSLLIVVLFCWYVLRMVLSPIRRVGDAARRLAGGDWAARAPAAGRGEVAGLATSFNAMADSLEQSRDELESQNSELGAQQAELESAVDELAFEKERVERLHSFGLAVTTEIDLHRVAEIVLHELSALVDAELGVVYAHLADRSEAACVGTLGFGSAAEVAPLVPNSGLAGRALAEGVTLCATNTEAALTAPTFGEHVTVRHETHVPLVHGRQVVGLLTLARITNHAFSPAQLDQIEHFANRAAAAVANGLTLRAAQSEAALNEAVLETAADAFVSIDRTGRIIAWNRAAEEMFGWAADEAIGLVLGETIVPPALREAHARGVARIAAGRESGLVGRRTELTALHREGHEFPVEVLISSLEREGELQFNAFLRDISDRKRGDRFMGAQYAVTRALSEASTLFEARTNIVPALAEALGFDAATAWVVDHDDGIIRNSAVWAADGVDADEFLHASELAEFERGEGLPGRVWATGQPFWIEDLTKESHFARAAGALSAGLRGAFVYPVMSGDQMIGMGELFSRQTICVDPDLDKLIVTLGAQIGQFSERMRAELEADRLKDEFFALVSHELRTPLTSIIGYLELVLEDADDLTPDTSRFLQVVERNSRRLHRLVGDLLFVAQVEAGKLSLERSPFDLPGVIGACVEAARPRAEENGVLLKARTEDVGDSFGDGDRLGQVLDNLVSNAIKFTPEGGTVDVYLTRRGDSAIIEVRDSGIGIPQAEQDRMFQRFFRSSTATAKAIPGVGLGLVISRAIVEGHDGKIDFESEEGHGTTFRVDLPLGSLNQQASNANPLEVLR